MSTQTDPLAVAQLVATLRHHADLIRARAALVVAGARSMRWQSQASILFHDCLDEALGRLTRCASEFDRAADSIEVLAASR